MVNREPMVKKRINPFYEAFRQRSVKFERLPKSLLYDDRGRFTPNECSLGSSLRPRVKKGMYGQLTLNLLSKNNSLRVPPLPPPPLPKKTNSPPNPARRRKTSDHKMGYCVTFGKLPPPPPGLRTNGILYKSCSILQGVDSGVLITKSSQIRKN